MKDNFFVDSNIFIYLFEEDKDKYEITKKLLLKKPVVSTQVINENINVCIKKLKLPKNIAFKHAQKLISKSYLSLITYETIKLAFNICETLYFSYYDSLIIASALENNCSILYSEDLQHNQVIKNQLKIINPFL